MYDLEGVQILKSVKPLTEEFNGLRMRDCTDLPQVVWHIFHYKTRLFLTQVVTLEFYNVVLKIN